MKALSVVEALGVVRERVAMKFPPGVSVEDLSMEALSVVEAAVAELVQASFSVVPDDVQLESAECISP